MTVTWVSLSIAAILTHDPELPANLHIFVYIMFVFKHCVKGCYEERETRKVALGES